MPQDFAALQARGLLPDHAHDLESVNPTTQYFLEARVEFDPASQTAQIDGLARIQLTNHETSDWNDLPLMLWPNDPQYRSTMVAGPALIDGQMVFPTYELDNLALRLDLPNRVRPGETVDVSLPFQIAARGPIGGIRPYRFGITEGVLLAPTFYPLVPRRVDGEWEVGRAPSNGDTTNSDVSLYWVRLTVPAGLQLVASGVEVGREVGPNTQTVTFATGPMRDFAFALGDLSMQSRKAGPVTVRAWLLPGHIDEMDAVLGAAAFQVELLSEKVGPYPYPELDVVDAPGAFGGIEYPGLVFIGTIGGADEITPTVHEVGHQWFYGLIGNDQLLEPWLDEAAATYTEVLYFEARDGPGRAAGMLSEFRSWLQFHPDPDTPIGLPVADYPSLGDYALFVYIKGALFFDALRSEIGDEAFLSFLHTYDQRFVYGLADTSGFRDAAEVACACDLSSLFARWVTRGGALPGP
jgi:hypothetical protein